MQTHAFALVGYGGMGRWHRQGICRTERVTFAGVYDIDPARMELARQDGIPTLYASFEELLADPAIEGVVIATPNNFHLPQVVQALEAGKLVVCEKPVAMTSAELETMMATAKRTGSHLTVHQNRRRDPDFLAMRDAVERGLLGEVFEIESRVNGSRGIPEGWRQYTVAGGGMMLDWGVHLIDQMLTMYTAPVTDVYCELYHVHYTACDDGFKMILHFENGPSVTIEVGTSHYIQAPRWYVYGGSGALVIPDWDCNGTIVRAREQQVTWEEEIVYTKAGPTKTMAPRRHDTVEELAIDGDQWTEDYDAYYRNLADVLEGKADLLVKPAEALRVMKVMEAGFASHAQKAVIHGPF